MTICYAINVELNWIEYTISLLNVDVISRVSVRHWMFCPLCLVPLRDGREATTSSSLASTLVRCVEARTNWALFLVLSQCCGRLPFLLCCWCTHPQAHFVKWDPLQLTSTGDSLFPRSGLDTSTLPSLIRVFHLFSLPRAQSALSLILPLDTRTIELYLVVRATSAGHFSFVPRSTLICKFWDSWTSWY